MTHEKDDVRTAAPLPLSEMLARYLSRHVDAQAGGLGSVAAVGEVVPFESAPVQPVNPRAAWDEAQVAARYYGPATAPATPPADWPQLVATHEPEMALAFCIGNFPQMVRDLHGLLQAGGATNLSFPSSRPQSIATLPAWAEQAVACEQYPQALIALGALRLARQFELAEQLASRVAAAVPVEWRAGWANEQAALCWHAGRTDEAVQRWREQDATVPVLFNRGMAALFMGRKDNAQACLNQAVGQISEESGWHHLGRLYLALAEMEG